MGGKNDVQMSTSRSRLGHGNHKEVHRYCGIPRSGRNLEQENEHAGIGRSTEVTQRHYSSAANRRWQTHAHILRMIEFWIEFCTSYKTQSVVLSRQQIEEVRRCCCGYMKSSRPSRKRVITSHSGETVFIWVPISRLSNLQPFMRSTALSGIQ